MEIELRAWDKLDKKMYYNVGISLIGVQIYGESKDQQPPETIILDRGRDLFEIMLWTGLKDKNGVKIFEGDIVRLHYSSANIIDGAVTWFSANRYPGDGIFGMETATWVMSKYLKETGKECNQHFYHLSVEDIREVIGNIYESRHLLASFELESKSKAV